MDRDLARDFEDPAIGGDDQVTVAKVAAEVIDLEACKEGVPALALEAERSFDQVGLVIEKVERTPAEDIAHLERLARIGGAKPRSNLAP